MAAPKATLNPNFLEALYQAMESKAPTDVVAATPAKPLVRARRPSVSYQLDEHFYESDPKTEELTTHEF